MLSSLNTNYDNTISANKASATENSITKSADSQANEDEKTQNSQIPKMDSVEISSQARAAIKQVNATTSAQGDSSAQNNKSSTQTTSSVPSVSKKSSYNPDEVLTGKTKSQMDSLVQKGIITKAEENKELKSRVAVED